MGRRENGLSWVTLPGDPELYKGDPTQFGGTKTQIVSPIHRVTWIWAKAAKRSQGEISEAAKARTFGPLEILQF